MLTDSEKQEVEAIVSDFFALQAAACTTQEDCKCGRSPEEHRTFHAPSATPTHVEGRRVAAAFPCIGKQGLVDTVTVTVDEDPVGRKFYLHRVYPDGKTFAFDPAYEVTFPRALRRARQAQGWE